MGDLDTLIEFGFEKERAEIALKKSGNLNSAIEWLGSVQDKSIEEVRAEIAASSSSTTAAAGEGTEDGDVANSLVCNDCGKKFRTQAQAEFHAEKTEHVNFSQSTEEIAPLTEEEKKARLNELRERLREKRAGQSVQDKADQKRNEEIRRKSTKESQDIKEDLQKKERLKEAAAKRREKADDIAAKEAIRAKIQADKDARKAKADAEKAARQGVAPPAPPTASAPQGQSSGGPAAAAATPQSKPASAYTETRLRLQTAGKGNIVETFPVETTLFEVVSRLQGKGVEAKKFVQNFPKKEFDEIDFGATLKELGLVPSASLIVK